MISSSSIVWQESLNIGSATCRSCSDESSPCADWFLCHWHCSEGWCRRPVPWKRQTCATLHLLKRGKQFGSFLLSTWHWWVWSSILFEWCASNAFLDQRFPFGIHYELVNGKECDSEPGAVNQLAIAVVEYVSLLGMEWPRCKEFGSSSQVQTYNDFGSEVKFTMWPFVMDHHGQKRIHLLCKIAWTNTGCEWCHRSAGEVCVPHKFQAPSPNCLTTRKISQQPLQCILQASVHNGRRRFLTFSKWHIIVVDCHWLAKMRWNQTRKQSMRETLGSLCYIQAWESGIFWSFHMERRHSIMAVLEGKVAQKTFRQGLGITILLFLCHCQVIVEINNLSLTSDSWWMRSSLSQAIGGSRRSMHSQGRLSSVPNLPTFWEILMMCMKWRISVWCLNMFPLVSSMSIWFKQNTISSFVHQLWISHLSRRPSLLLFCLRRRAIDVNRFGVTSHCVQQLTWNNLLLLFVCRNSKDKQWVVASYLGENERL